MSLMNEVFHKYLDKFIQLFIENIDLLLDDEGA
jgi:hypothetical protein